MAAIYFHKKRKKWYIILTLPPKKSGEKRTQIWSRGFSTRAEAVDSEPHFVLEHRSAKQVRRYGGIGFVDFCNEWLKSLENGLEWTTIRKQYLPYTKRMIRYFKDPRLTEIDQTWITDFIAESLDPENPGHIAPNTARKVLSQLVRMFKYAMTRKYLEHNEALYVKPPKGTTHQKRILDDDEIQRLISEARKAGERVYLAVLLGLCAGLSGSEAAGLKWTDFTPGQLFIHRKLIQGRVGEPKNRHRQAPVDIPQVLTEALTVATRVSEYVLTSPKGHPIRWENFLRRDWAPLIAKTGLEGLTYHGLRHTYVSHMLDKGTSLADASRQARHGSPKTTAGIYTHTIPGKRRISGAMDEWFSEVCVDKQLVNATVTK